MSAVDVLAVMQRDHLHGDSYRATHSADADTFHVCTMESKEARAAVAELMEKSTNALRMLEAISPTSYRTTELAAALARCKGEKA